MSLAGGAVVSIWHDIAPEGRDDFYAWHTHEHMPERVGIPGFLRGRRCIAVEGDPQFFNLYEARSLDVLGGPDYQARLNAPTPWTLRAVSYFDNVARAIQNVRYSYGDGLGGFVMTVRMEADDTEALTDALSGDVFARAADMHGVTGVHLCQTCSRISNLSTREREARDGGTAVPGWTVLIEADRLAVLKAVRDRVVTADALRAAGAATVGEPAIYRIEFLRCSAG